MPKTKQKEIRDITGADVTVNIATVTKKGQNKTATLRFFNTYLDEKRSKALFAELKQIEWDEMFEAGNWNAIIRNSRKMKWYSDYPNATYAFSSRSIGGVNTKTGEFTEGGLKPHAFTPTLDRLRRKVTRLMNTKAGGIKPMDYFNSVLVNYYKDGNDSVAWHADNDPWLGQNFTVPSISIGATRIFSVKPNHGGTETNFQLRNGSLLLMSGMTQEAFKHSVPKGGGKKIPPRINLTFRHVKRSLIRQNPSGMTWDAARERIIKRYSSVISDPQRNIIREAGSPAEIYELTLQLERTKKRRKRAKSQN